MEIKVMSKIEAIEYVNEHEIPECTCVISISEPVDVLPIFSNPNLYFVHYMRFWDIVTDFKDIKVASSKDIAGLKAFIDKIKDDCECLIIHCHAGISRSAAIASAVSEYLGISHSFFSDDIHHPNIHVYRLACEELGIAKDSEYYSGVFSEGI